MKKEENKGLTLIALVITIIVMLILIAVTVNIALNGGLFEITKDSSNKTSWQAEKEYSYAADSEGLEKNEIIKYYTSEEQDRELKIGERVYYKEGEKTSGIYSTTENANLDWAYFGTSEEGNILLISTNPIGKKYGTSATSTFEHYMTLVEKLNTICNDLYGAGTNRQGESVADYARSLTQADIDKICNIDENTRKELKKTYGTAPYQYTTGKFLEYDENQNTYTIVNASESNKIAPIDTYYTYKVEKYIDDSIIVGLLNNGMDYETGEINEDVAPKQWCATRVVSCLDEKSVWYSVLTFSKAGFWSTSCFTGSNGTAGGGGGYIRPIVVLDANASLKLNKRTGIWDIEI